MITPQEPLKSGYDAYSTSMDVARGINLTGKLAIVTGGYAGLGLETARTLASAGARVIVPARDISRAKQAIANVGACIEVQPMDLTDPDSIRHFSRKLVQSGLALHILINNAGIMASPDLVRDSRGNELQLSTNHLGHFQLTLELWQALRRAEGARVVSVSSMGHRLGDIDYDDINFKHREYDGWAAYGQSKTANILFATELDRRGIHFGIRSFSLHPGGIVTGLAKHIPTEQLIASGNMTSDGTPVIDPSRDMKSIPQGAATHVWCAVHPALCGRGGVFCVNSDIAEVEPTSNDTTNATPARKNYGVAPYAIDSSSAQRLWSLSEELTETQAPDGI